ncbi:MAG: hypothetical protein ACREDF_06420, partial [Thermoplasmata archaeon]
MRARALALSVLLAAMLLAPTASAEDFGAVSKVNKLISIQETPSLAPGDSGRFVFFFNSTYTVETMRNVTLNASVYRYATIDESVAVDASWPYAYPQIAETGTQAWTWTSPAVPPGTSIPLNFTIVTARDSHDMPHGSVFSQSSYFVRFELEFDGNVSGNQTPFRMASRGFFTTAEWATATSANYTNPC